MEAWEERATRLEVLYEKLADRMTALERDVASMKISVAALERDVAALKATVDALVANCATKADVAEVKASIIMWVVSLFFLSQVIPGLMDLLGM